MNGVDAVALPNVTRAYLERAVAEAGVDWHKACHITATASLASAFLADETLAISIASLTDLVVMPGMPEPFRVDTTGFPGPSVRPLRSEERKAAIKSWRSEISGHRLAMGMRFDQRLEACLRSTQTAEGMSRAILTGRREVRRTLQTLIASGFAPDQVRPESPIAAEVHRSWVRLEAELPELTAVREDLWVSEEDYRGERTQRARSVKERLQNALTAAFGPADGERLVVHHGFYFYTPPQWAIFRLLANTPGVRQLFITHSDGRSPVFDTWSRFFRSSFDLPIPELREWQATVTPQAR